MSYGRNNNQNNSMQTPWQRNAGNSGGGGSSFGNSSFGGARFSEMSHQQQPYNNANNSNSSGNYGQMFGSNSNNNSSSGFVSPRDNQNSQQSQYFGGNNDNVQENQSAYIYNSIGTVTQVGAHWCLVNDEVLFDRSACRGDAPSLGSRVLFEAVPNMVTQQPYKWNAKRIQLMTPKPAPTMSPIAMNMNGDGFGGGFGGGAGGGGFNFGNDGFGGQRNISNDRSMQRMGGGGRDGANTGGQRDRFSAPAVSTRRNNMNNISSSSTQSRGGQINRGSVQTSRGSVRTSRGSGPVNSGSIRTSRSSVQVSRGSGQISRASGQATRGAGTVSRVAGSVSRASGPVSRASGQATRGAGPVSRASGQATRGAGSVSRASGPVNRASGPVTRGGAQINRSINATSSLSQNKAKPAGSSVAPVKRSAVSVVAPDNAKKLKTAETEMRAATKVIDRLEKIPKEKWDEKQHQSLLWAMGILKKDTGSGGKASSKDETKTSAQKVGAKSNDPNMSASSSTAESNLGKAAAKQQRNAARILERIELVPKDKLTPKDISSMAWAKKVLSDDVVQGDDQKKTARPSKERRAALLVLDRLKQLPADEWTERQKTSFAWATALVGSGDADEEDTAPTGTTANKRQAETESSASPNAKKPRQSQKVDQHIIVSVVDKSQEDGSISPEKWQQVEIKLAAVFPDILKKHPGGAPCCRNVVWYRDRVRHLVACADQRSVDLYKIAMAQIGKELWAGAKLEVAVFNQIPSELRVRAWIPAEPSEPQTILDIIRACNPDLHTDKWVVTQLEASRGQVRSATFVVDSKSLVSLSSTGGVISYGFSAITIEEVEDDDDEEPPTIALDDSDNEAVDDAEKDALATDTIDEDMHAEEDDAVPADDSVEDAITEDDAALANDSVENAEDDAALATDSVDANNENDADPETPSIGA